MVLSWVLRCGIGLFAVGQAQMNDTKSACSYLFSVPAPAFATDLNGVAWPPLCLESRASYHEEHFFIIGDWGGISRPWIPPLPADMTSSRGRPFVAGVDDNAQQLVANQMKMRAQVNMPRYVLNAGDNFYWGGITMDCGLPSNKTVQTDQWEHVFERVYQGPGLDGVPWMGVLGNHDYGGYMFTAAWEQNIAYTWHHVPPVHQGRWVTPALYWSRRVQHPMFTVDIFFTDSNVNDAFHPEHHPGTNMCSLEHNPPNASCGDHGPSSVWDCAGWFRRLWDEQVPWLSSGLAASDADWQFIVTHFPPDFQIDFWARLSERYGIDLIVGGHRHQEEVHYKDSFAGGILGDTAWVVAGGGGGVTSEGLPRVDGQDDMYGFMDVTISKDRFVIDAISHSGIIRSSTLVRPRQKSAPGVTATTNTVAGDAPVAPPRALRSDSESDRAVDKPVLT